MVTRMELLWRTVPQDGRPRKVQNVLSFTRRYQAFCGPSAKSRKWCLRGPHYKNFMLDLLATTCISKMSGGQRQRQDKTLNIVMLALGHWNIIYSRLPGLFGTSAMSWKCCLKARWISPRLCHTANNRCYHVGELQYRWYIKHPVTLNEDGIVILWWWLLIRMR
jgi:hypothetical protein